MAEPCDTFWNARGVHFILLATETDAPQPFLSDTVGVAIVTGLVSVLTAVLTVLLTNRHARRESAAVRENNATEAEAIRTHAEKEAEAERREHRRAEVRGLVAEFVNSAEGWTQIHDMLVPVYYKSGTEKRFWLEWVDTDAGKELRENAMRLTRASGELRLVVRDQDLLDRLNEAMSAIDDRGPMKALLGESERTGGRLPKQSVMRDVFAHYRDVRARIKAVEHRAADLLRGDL